MLKGPLAGARTHQPKGQERPRRTILSMNNWGFEPFFGKASPYSIQADCGMSAREPQMHDEFAAKACSKGGTKAIIISAFICDYANTQSSPQTIQRVRIQFFSCRCSQGHIWLRDQRTLFQGVCYPGRWDSPSCRQNPNCG